MKSQLIFGAALASALAITTPAAPAQAKALTCHGEKATIAKHRGKVVGTPKRDVIILTGKGRVRALAGDDLICGSPKRDIIRGGGGKDRIFGGARARYPQGRPWSRQDRRGKGSRPATGRWRAGPDVWRSRSRQGGRHDQLRILRAFGLLP